MSDAAGALERRDSIDGFAAAVMIGLTFSWGFNQVAIKVANVGYNPIFAVLLRSVIACVLVLLWCRLRRIPLFERDGTLGAGILAGVLFGGEFALIFLGLDFTTAARSALMINTMPFWVLIGAHFLLGEHITRLKLAGVALAFCGVFLVFSDKLSVPGPSALWGDLMCLGAGILWAATILVIKGSRLARASAEKTLLYQLSVSALFVVPFVPLAGPALRDVTALATASLLFQAVFIVAFTYVLWFWLMRRYPASGLSSFAFLTPAFGVLCGGFLLGETVTPRIFLALGLIAAGLVLVNRRPRSDIPA
ncbi:DMT family transporter [Aquamicrobium sp. LC103]|uniref:DMT family transporter n=1 Tax=Aquamicrobium sp. LC103 TaxID=1120658 RepID=UPI00063EAED0|nr:DMT family transporter [Aquamicrobium sp. LC103]TKT79286.1 DMT family transporter [Aquamicrobium sp. LC103]